MKSRAIVISYSHFGEADKYVQFLTQRWGMVTAIAKSARKSRRRYAGGLDLFCHNEVFFRGDPKGTPYLNELTVLNSFQKLRADLDKILLAGRLVHWVKKLADTHDPIPDVYSLLGQSLTLIERETRTERLEMLALVFKLKLLSCLGVKPQLNPKRSGLRTHYFSIESGSLVDHQGQSGHPLSEIERNLLFQSESMKLTQWESYEFALPLVDRLSRLMTQFASYHHQVPLPL